MPHDANSDKPYKGQHYAGIAEVAHSDQGGGADCCGAVLCHNGESVCGDNARAFKADNGDEQANARGDAVLQVGGDGIDQGLPELEERQDNEDDAFYQDGGEGYLPGVCDAHANEHGADGVGKIGVKPHAGGQGYRVICENAHDDGGHGGGHGGCREHSPLIHSRVRQHAGVHSQDIGHGQERGDAGDNFGLYVGAVFLELKKTYDLFQRSSLSLFQKV